VGRRIRVGRGRFEPASESLPKLGPKLSAEGHLARVGAREGGRPGRGSGAGPLDVDSGQTARAMANDKVRGERGKRARSALVEDRRPWGSPDGAGELSINPGVDRAVGMDQQQTGAHSGARQRALHRLHEREADDRVAISGSRSDRRNGGGEAAARRGWRSGIGGGGWDDR